MKRGMLTLRVHCAQCILYWEFCIKYDKFVAQREYIKGTSTFEEGPNLAQGFVVNEIEMASVRIRSSSTIREPTSHFLYLRAH